ncbi:hypothetical protein ACWJJH_02760 [Endozoicomonadaceae bacterium StTr2]
MLEIRETNLSFSEEQHVLTSSLNYSDNDIYIHIAGTECKDKIALFNRFTKQYNKKIKEILNWDHFNDYIFELITSENKNIFVYIDQKNSLLRENKSDENIFYEIISSYKATGNKKKVIIAIKD